jgi:hypothetical protein
VTVPDTKLAREATELVRERTSDLVYHHSRRVYWWGSLQGRNRGSTAAPTWPRHPSAVETARMFGNDNLVTLLEGRRPGCSPRRLLAQPMSPELSADTPAGPRLVIAWALPARGPARIHQPSWAAIAIHDHVHAVS